MTEADLIYEAFLNGIISLRARGQTMEESCHRAFYAVGINSASAQHEIRSYFQSEEEFFMNQQSQQANVLLLPNYLDTVTFLNTMTIKYQGSSKLVKKPEIANTLETKENSNEKENENGRAQREKKRRQLRKHEDHQAGRGRKSHQNRSKRSLRGKSGPTPRNGLERSADQVKKPIGEIHQVPHG